MATTRKLTIDDILKAEACLAKLKSHPDLGTNWNIGKDLKLLIKEGDEAREKRDDKIAELSPVNGNISKEPMAAQTAFRVWGRAFGKMEVEVVGILPLKRSKLLVEGYELDADTLAGIMPLIEDDGSPEPYETPADAKK